MNEVYATHPSGLQIRFTDHDHVYEDARGHQYLSGTSFLKDFFSPFEADKVAGIIAEKEGKSPAQVKAEWKWARDSGTRMHENCEAQCKGLPPVHQPQNQNEYTAFVAAHNCLHELMARFKLIGAELIVFSPRYHIAGTIDLLMYAGNGVYSIFDWKKCKAIYQQGFDDARALHPISHMQDCNGVKYGLQLALYERIMRDEGYIEPDATVTRTLLHAKPMADRIECYEIQDYRSEVTEMLLWHAYDLERAIPGVPF